MGAPEENRSRMKARLAHLKASSARRRGQGDLVARFGLLAMLLLPAGFGYFAYVFAADAFLAVTDARAITGVVHDIEQETTTYREDNTTKTSVSYRILVRFRAENGEERTMPLQHGGASDEDTRFARDIIDIDDYQIGSVIDLYYHPELGHRIWPDDFRAIWLLPLVLGGAALAALFLVLGATFALWPRNR